MYLGSLSWTQYVSNEEQVFLDFARSMEFLMFSFAPRSVWTNRTKNTGTLKMQLHQEFSVLYSINIFLNKCIEYRLFFLIFFFK